MAAEHPGPWAWWRLGGIRMADDVWHALRDANGCELIDVGEDAIGEAAVRLESSTVRVLTELAPNLERLREIEWEGAPVEDGGYNTCPNPQCSGDRRSGHEPDCWIGDTLARIDAAKAG